jgi:GNAT superfamily N-acetyltransferase
LARPLLRHGFNHVTNIIHLEHPGGVMAPPIDDFELVTAPDVRSQTFRRLLIRCHDDSMDCPELHARRDPDDVLKGYLDTAPELHGWCIATWHGEPIGVAITCQGELSFLGMIPEARGQGLGHVFLGQILDRMSGPCRLIVDERNIPARRAYDRAGFRPTGVRLVYLWFAS